MKSLHRKCDIAVLGDMPIPPLKIPIDEIDIELRRDVMETVKRWHTESFLRNINIAGCAGLR